MLAFVLFCFATAGTRGPNNMFSAGVGRVAMAAPLVASLYPLGVDHKARPGSLEALAERLGSET